MAPGQLPTAPDNIPENPQKELPPLKTALAAIFIALVAGAAFTLATGNVGFWTSDEARYAAGAREILEKGLSVEVTVNGRHEDTKPPLSFYLVALSGYIAGGRVTEVVARVPSLTAAIATALVLYLLAARFLSRRAA